MRSVSYFVLATAAVMSAAKPLRVTEQQQILVEDSQKRPHHSNYQPDPSRPRSHVDAVQNSVGVLFTLPETREVLHVWLPLGQKVYTRDAPELPLHPLAARITTTIRSTPEKATSEHLDRVICTVHPSYNRTKSGEHKGAEWSVQFSKSDELVRFVEPGSESWLVGREVEAYECS